MSRKTPEPKSKDQEPEKGQALSQNPPSGNIIIIFIRNSLKFHFISTLPYLKTPKDQSHRLAGKLKSSAGGGEG